MKLQKRYEWRELQNGLLLEPKKAGPYYDRDSLDDSFESEEEALKRFIDFKKMHEYSAPSELVLLTFYFIAQE